jgi:hypothetical protein
MKHLMTSIYDCLKKPCAGRRLAMVLPLLLALTAMSSTWAQQKPSPQPKAALTAENPPQKADPISAQQATYLVRSALLRLNDANRSGNYTVLRDLAAPDFQARNSPADLAQSFADLRRRNFDLFAVALLAPEFTAAPAAEKNGTTRLSGFFPTRPLLIRFDLIFQSVNGTWRLYAISVSTPDAPTPQSRLDRPQPASRRLFYAARLFDGKVGWRW